MTPSTVYLVTLTADHDFDAVRVRRAFTSRQVAAAWAAKMADEFKAADEAYDGWDGYGYSTLINAIDLDDTAAVGMA